MTSQPGQRNTALLVAASVRMPHPPTSAQEGKRLAVLPTGVVVVGVTVSPVRGGGG